MSDRFTSQRGARQLLRERRLGGGQIAENFRRLLARDATGALNQMRRKGKVTLNSDDLFLLCPEYAEQPEQRPILGPQLYQVARRFIDRSYERLLSRRVRGDDTVVFTAGGSATGKSTILRAAGKRSGVDFIVDTTFSDTKRALAQVDRALSAGRKVEIYYVYRHFRDCVVSMLKRAHDPASGRLVPVDDMARTHYGAPRAILAALQKYQKDRRVLIRLTKNEGGRRLSQMTLRDFERHIPKKIDDLQLLGQSVLNGLYKSTRGKRKSGARNRKDHDVRRNGLSLRFALYKAARSKAQTAGTTSRKGNARPRKPSAKKST